MENKISLAQIVAGNKEYYEFLPKKMEQVHFCKDCNSIRFISDNIVKRTDLKGNSIWQMSLDEICNILDKKYVFIPNLNFLTENENVFWITNGCKIFFIDCSEKKVIKKIKIFSDWINITYNEKLDTFCFSQENKIYYLAPDGTKHIIKNAISKDIYCGVIPSREEFGINKPIFFSPKGSKVAFYIVDKTRITKYPIVRLNEPISTTEMIEYPTAGNWSEEVYLAIYDFNSNKLIYLEKSNWSESYKTCVTWSPDESCIYVDEVNRNQKESRLQRFSAINGKLETIVFEEKDEKYIEPENPLYFIKNIDNLFIWQSRIDGYNQLYLYNTDGDMLCKLTNNNFEVTSINGYNEATGEIIYTAADESALNRNIFAVNITTGSTKKISKEDGINEAFLSDYSSLLIINNTSLNQPNKTSLLNLETSDETTLLNSENPLEKFNFPNIEIFSFSKNKTAINCRIIKPSNFDELKKYPLVVYVYGGPHVQLITNSWQAGAKDFEIMMANEDCLVLSLDTHGSAYRGKKFESSIYGNIGAKQCDDIKNAISYVSKNYKIRTDRIGIFGWSFGGFIATKMMLTEPDLFKVGVAGGAVTDWKLYEVMYTERYMGKPSENPEGYSENQLKNYINNLTGKFMMIHCDADKTVLIQNFYEMIKASIKAGKHIDTSIYPGYYHNIRGVDRIHLMETIRNYFKLHL